MKIRNTIYSILISLLTISCSQPPSTENVELIVPNTDLRIQIAHYAFTSDRSLFQGNLNVDNTQYSTVTHADDSASSYEEARNIIANHLSDWKTPISMDTLLEIKQTDLYYDFLFQLGNMNILHGRVFKSNALDRSGVDPNIVKGYYGTLYLKPYHTTFYLTLSYLFNQTKYNNTGNGIYQTSETHEPVRKVKVFVSSVDETFYFNKCVGITFRTLEYFLDEDSGDMFIATTVIDKFGAVLNSDHSVSLCDL